MWQLEEHKRLAKTLLPKTQESIKFKAPVVTFCASPQEKEVLEALFKSKSIPAEVRIGAPEVQKAQPQAFLSTQDVQMQRNLGEVVTQLQIPMKSQAKSKSAPKPVQKQTLLVGHVVHYDLNKPVEKTPEPEQPEVKMDIRAQAYKDLENFGQNKTSLNCTQICISVFNGKPCKHGANCRYAHNDTEWRDRVCKFGDTCKFEKCWNNTRHLIKGPTGESVAETRREFLARKKLSPEKIAAFFDEMPVCMPVCTPATFVPTPAPWINKN